MYQESVHIPIGRIQLEGDLVLPENAAGLVIFSHGSGSSRHSPRNRLVASELWKRHFGTLLFDLLTEAEDQDYDNRFNIDLLTERLVATTEWAHREVRLRDLPVGYFGASTGAASALRAAAALGNTIHAVVSRGGRPDLAMDALHNVSAPVLLIVGGLDAGVIELNQAAFQRIQAVKALEIVPGATHLFEEPGKLDVVARLAGAWFEQYLRAVI